MKDATGTCEECGKPIGFSSPYSKELHYTKDGIMYRVSFHHKKCRVGKQQKGTLLLREME